VGSAAAGSVRLPHRVRRRRPRLRRPHDNDVSPTKDQHVQRAIFSAKQATIGPAAAQRQAADDAWNAILRGRLSLDGGGGSFPDLAAARVRRRGRVDQHPRLFASACSGHPSAPSNSRGGSPA